jgi:hypothetical protein
MNKKQNKKKNLFEMNNCKVKKQKRDSNDDFDEEEDDDDFSMYSDSTIISVSK